MLALVLIPLIILVFALPFSADWVHHGRDNILHQTAGEIADFRKRFAVRMAYFWHAVIRVATTIAGVLIASWLVVSIMSAFIRSFLN